MLNAATILDKIYREISTEHQQLSIWYFVSFLFGCAYFFSLNQLITLSQVWIITICLSISLGIFRDNQLWRFFITLLLCFNLALLAGFIKQARNTNLKIEQSFITTIQGKIEQITKLNQDTRIILSDIMILKHNLKHQAPPQIHGRISMKIKDKYFKKIEIGDTITIKASIMPPPPKIIPGGYDFNFYANFNQISAIGFGMSEPDIISRNSNWWQNIQKKVYEKLTNSTGSVPANFISALIIGNSQGLDKGTMENMRLAGISHILCISGLHLSLVTLIFFKFFRFILNASNYLAHHGNIKVISGVISIICSYGYLKLSGSQVSATRAFIMCSVASIAILLQRDYSPLKAVAIASALILALNPQYALHPSFQLSFLAVLSLIAGYNSYMQIANNTKSLAGKIKHDILANFCSSMFVGFTTGPIVIYHFHILSNYSALANIVAIPITTFILMPCAFIWLFLASFDADLYLLQFMSYFVGIIVQTADFVSHLKYNTVYIGHISPASLSVYLIGFFWLIIWQSRIKYAGLLIIFISIIMMISAKKPDVILDIKKIAIGVQNTNSLLEIYSQKKFSYFSQEYWSLWFGQKQVMHHLIDTNENQRIITKNGKVVDLVIQNLDCQSQADITINYSQKTCTNNTQILNVNNKEKDFLFIWCNNQACRYKFYN